MPSKESQKKRARSHSNGKRSHGSDDEEPPKKSKKSTHDKSADRSDSSSLRVFEGLTIYFAGTLSRSRQEISNLIRKNGGNHSKYISPKLTCYVTRQENLDKENVQSISRAKKLLIPFVSEQFLYDSINAGELKPLKNYYLKYDASAAAQSAQESSDDKEDDDTTSSTTASTTPTTSSNSAVSTTVDQKANTSTSPPKQTQLDVEDDEDEPEDEEDQLPTKSKSKKKKQQQNKKRKTRSESYAVDNTYHRRAITRKQRSSVSSESDMVEYSPASTPTRAANKQSAISIETLTAAAASLDSNMFKSPSSTKDSTPTSTSSSLAAASSSTAITNLSDNDSSPFHSLPSPARKKLVEVIELKQYDNNATQVNFEDLLAASSSDRMQQLSSELAQLIGTGSDKPCFSDVTFEVSGVQFHSCRAILCARSSYFRTLLVPDKQGTASNHAVIHISNVLPAVFGCVLQFLCTGTASILTHSMAAQVYQYSLEIKLHSAMDMIVKYYEAQAQVVLSKVDLEQCVLLLDHLSQVSSHLLIEATTKIRQSMEKLIVDHALDVFNQPSILFSMSYDMMTQLLSVSPLDLSEELLLDKLIHWGVVNLARYKAKEATSKSTSQHKVLSVDQQSASDFCTHVQLSPTQSISLTIVADSGQAASSDFNAKHESKSHNVSFCTAASVMKKLSPFFNDLDDQMLVSSNRSSSTSTSNPHFDYVAKATELRFFLNDLLSLIMYEHMSQSAIFKLLEPKKIFKNDEILGFCKAIVEVKNNEPYIILGKTIGVPRQPRQHGPAQNGSIINAQNPPHSFEVTSKRGAFQYLIKLSDVTTSDQTLYLPEFDLFGTQWCVQVVGRDQFLSFYLHNRAKQQLMQPLSTMVQFKLNNYVDESRTKVVSFAKEWKNAHVCGISHLIDMEQLTQASNGWLNSSNNTDISLSLVLELSPNASTTSAPLFKGQMTENHLTSMRSPVSTSSTQHNSSNPHHLNHFSPHQQAQNSIVVNTGMPSKNSNAASTSTSAHSPVALSSPSNPFNK